MKYKVSANPKGGACFQFVEADSEEEAIAKARSNPNDWKSPRIKGDEDWNFRAYARQENRR